MTPVRELSQAMRQLASGELAVVAETGVAEVGLLPSGFNQTARTLTGHQQEIQAQIRHATTELKHKNQQLEAINRVRMRMLAAASHDLRQPLQALMLFADNLIRGETNEPRLQRLSSMQECVNHLDRMFTDLLSFTQLETGTLQPHRTDFALDRVFEDVSRTFRPIAEARMLRLIVRPTTVQIHTDPTMLMRILANLVCNALQNTHTGGVLLAARQRTETVQIVVLDTGIGIAPEQCARVFDEFYRIDQEYPASPETQRGLGLGLATVQRLARLLDIPLTLHSVIGRGTCIRLHLPIKTQAA